MRKIALGIVAGVALALAGDAASGAGSAGPTIDEMLRAVAGSDAGTGGATAPAPSRPTETPAPRHGPVVVPEASPGVEAGLKTVRERAKVRAKFYNGQDKLWNLCMIYVNLDNHKQAAHVFDIMIRKNTYNAHKSPVPGAARLAPGPLGYYGSNYYMERYGIVQMTYAKTLIALGQERAARMLLADAATRQAKAYGSSTPQAMLQTARTFIAGYEEAKAKLEALKSVLAEAPDGDRQWELAQHCAPGPGKIDRPLDRLEALLAMLEKYPDHKSVTSGMVHWDLCPAWRTFEMHENSVNVLDHLMATCRENSSVARGEALWEKAEALARLGLLREEHGMRNAIEVYQASLAAFEGFAKQFPKHSRNYASSGGTSTAQRRIRDVGVAVTRIMP